MNNLDKQYTALLQDILDNGVEKKDRTGTGTISVFGRQIRHKMSEGFPLLTTKKMHWRSIVTELLWFLRGDTNIRYLVDNDCHIWDGDAYKNYLKEQEKAYKIEYDKLSSNGLFEIDLDWQNFSQEEFINKIKTDDEFAKKWGELGPIYGKQWRSWNTMQGMKVEGGDGVPYVLGWKLKQGNDGEPTHDSVQIDQIANSINLLKTDPDSRRNRVNAWNVGELDQMVLPPCHTDFQFYTRELGIIERIKLAEQTTDIIPGFDSHFDSDEDVHKVLDTWNIPTRAISLMWNQRSVDTFLGLPFNIASYGLLLEIIAKAVNMVPDELIGNLGDVHLYSNHVEQAKEQIGRELTHRERIEKLFETNKDAKSLLSQEEPEVISSLLLDELKIPTRTREPYPLPTLKHLRSDEKYRLLPEFPSLWGEFKITDFELENYQSHPTIKAKLSN
jgi:thymidylate synthase